ncbi:MAG: 3-phosphoshikimate 1-carboxyvinyltransferase [Acidimicrobiaceae bacterium]|nr:3-phosphoshikimate 1-carboxyvinyltransferase [Acidimicrobiaceae bacterium]
MNPSRRVDRLGRLRATVGVPGSKSIANRALVCAALAGGTSTLTNLPDGDDTSAMAAALRVLDVPITIEAGRAVVEGGRLGDGAVTVHAGLAGTTSRFLLALASLGDAPITIDGDPPLRARPFAPLTDALAQLGVDVEPGERPGHLPVTVTGPPRSGAVSLRGDVSSQFVSSLMMIGPSVPGGLQITLTSPLVSVPYVDLTARVMEWFGVDGVERHGDSIVVPSAGYRAAVVTVEPDASSASYPLALAAVCGGRVTVPGLGVGALQGDARFADLLGAMGCAVTRNRTGVTVESGGVLRGIDVDMADISDLVPTMAVVAACASSPTRIRGVGFIRAKESDRLGDLSAELRRLGVDVDAVQDGLDIRPSAATIQGGSVGTHHDHRLAMAFAVLGSRVGGVEVRDPDVVSKSWPGFWRMLDAVAGRR